MWARIDKRTGELKHWSQPPFTVAPTRDEQDIEFPPDTILPASTRFVKVAAGQLVVDKTLLPKQFSWIGPDPAGSIPVENALNVRQAVQNRIKFYLGDVDSYALQLRDNRLRITAEHGVTSPTWPDGKTITATDKSKATADLAILYQRHLDIEAIYQQGEDFIRAQGW